MITSIAASFLSRLFSSQTKVIKKTSNWTKRLAEKGLDKKPAPN